jgi:hypothetical protein
MKIIIYLFFISFLFYSCKNNSEKIPINNIWEHIVYQEQSGIQDVEENYKVLFDKNTKSPELYFIYSRCISDYTKKLNLLTEGLSKFPNNPLLLASLGLAYYGRMNSEDLGTFFCNKAIEVDRQNVFATYGLIIYNKKKFDSSESIQQKLNISLSLHNLLRNFQQMNHHEILINNIELKKIIENNQNQVEVLKNIIFDCTGLSSVLRNNEIARISRMSQMIVSKLNVFYLGDCQYEVIGEAFDQMYGNFKNILIYYEYDGRDWRVIQQPNIINSGNNSDEEAPAAVDDNGNLNNDLNKDKNYDKIQISRSLDELAQTKFKVLADQKSAIEKHSLGNLSDYEFKKALIHFSQMQEAIKLREQQLKKQYDASFIK